MAAVVECARQFCAAHQELVDPGCGVSAFCNGPDDQALATCHVASGEDFFDVRLLAVSVGFDIPSPVQLNAKLLHELIPFGSDKAPGLFRERSHDLDRCR